MWNDFDYKNLSSHPPSEAHKSPAYCARHNQLHEIIYNAFKLSLWFPKKHQNRQIFMSAIRKLSLRRYLAILRNCRAIAQASFMIHLHNCANKNTLALCLFSETTTMCWRNLWENFKLVFCLSRQHFRHSLVLTHHQRRQWISLLEDFICSGGNKMRLRHASSSKMRNDLWCFWSRCMRLDEPPFVIITNGIGCSRSMHNARFLQN